jgi:hypothetical protein
MELKLEIIPLYEWKDVYQVVELDEDNYVKTTWHQSTLKDCKKYLKKMKK